MESSKEQNTTNLDDLAIESWLDENPSFLSYYLKLHKQKVLKILESPKSLNSNELKENEQSLAVFCSGKSSTNSETPTTQVNELIHDNLTLLDSKINNLNSSLSTSILSGNKISTVLSPSSIVKNILLENLRSQKTLEKLESLKELNEEDFLNKSLKEIGTEWKIPNLFYKILQNLAILLKCDRCSLFLVEENPGDSDLYLTATVFNVNGYAEADFSTSNEEIKMQPDSGIISHVIQTGEIINIEDVCKDDRFNKEIDLNTGYSTKSILCVPIKTNNAQVIAVAQAVNKKENGEQEFTKFTEKEIKILEKYSLYFGIIIMNTQNIEKYIKEVEENKLFIELATALFEEQNSLDNILNRLIKIVSKFFECEECTFILLDLNSAESKFSKIISFKENETKQIKFENEQIENKLNCRRNIFNVVVQSGETATIKTLKHEFDKNNSVKSGIEQSLRSYLCAPIKDNNGKVIGLLELVNLKFNSPSNIVKNRLFEAISLFCGIAIVNTNMQERYALAAARQKVTMEVLSYHANISSEDVKQLVEISIPSAEKLNLTNFNLDDESLTDLETLTSIIRIFLDMNFISRFNIDYKKLCSWILTVKKNYRNITYHNWRHAFNVMQLMFCILSRPEIGKCFDDLEKLALIVSCICHDLDHRGFSNNFLKIAGEPLAELYSTSIMEFHHVDHAIMIFNFKGNEIMNNLSNEEYAKFIQLLKDCILATDVSLYYARREKFFTLSKKLKNENVENYFKQNILDKELLRGMLMTACDLSSSTKSWAVQNRISNLVKEEFFHQGDIEKHVLCKRPIEMMDREKKDQWPKCQYEYLRSLCLPLYIALGEIWGDLNCLQENCRINMNIWKEMNEKTIIECE